MHKGAGQLGGNTYKVAGIVGRRASHIPALVHHWQRVAGPQSAVVLQRWYLVELERLPSTMREVKGQ